MAKLVVGKKVNQKSKAEDEASSKGSWNTPRSDSHTGMSYGTRMALAFALTSFMTVIILIVVVSVVWQDAFTEYTRTNMEEIAEITAVRLADGYEDAGEWTDEILTSAADSGNISDDIGMQVTDVDGTIIYDDTFEDDPVGSSVTRVDEAEDATGETVPAEDGASSEDDAGSETSAATDATAAEEDGDSTADEDEDSDVEQVSTAPTSSESTVSVPITGSDGETLGQVRLWVMGSDALLTDADYEFRAKTYNAMITAAVFAIVISVIIGLLVSRMLTKPVQRITDTAKKIRDGDLSARTEMHGDDEIDRLGETFDEMAVSLEKDLKHERRLTSDVAHELRTPLMAIQANVEAMEDGVFPADYEHLETVASETRRLSRLVQQTIDLSRLENHTTPLNLEYVDVAQLVRTVVNNQHQLFHERGVHLLFDSKVQGKDAIIEIDPDMITQAVTNLLSNAMRYTPEGGYVYVSVAMERHYVTISVKDTGIGIAKEDLSRIFDRFWRADASRARDAGGLGVGLALTKHIVERHEGYISVESEVGKGSTFVIYLPRERDDDEDEEPSSGKKR